jgi:hypothetical protein
MDSSYAGVGGLIIDSGLEDRSRDVISLDDGRVVHVGKNAGVAAVYVTDVDGNLDPAFGTDGVQTYPAHDGNLYDVDATADLIASVGSTASTADGAFLVLLNIGE